MCIFSPSSKKGKRSGTGRFNRIKEKFVTDSEDSDRDISNRMRTEPVVASVVDKIVKEVVPVRSEVAVEITTDEDPVDSLVAVDNQEKESCGEVLTLEEALRIDGDETETKVWES